MMVDVNELIKRYEEARKNGVKANRKGIAQRIRQYVLEKIGDKGYVALRDVVRGLIDEGIVEEIGLEPRYNMVYNRVRQAVVNSKNSGLALGMDEDGTVVVVKI